MKTQLARIEKSYDAIQRQFNVQLGAIELARATQFYTNRDRPVHRWFHFKEGFAADLLTALQVDTSRLGNEDTFFLDPFCGSGTSLLAGDLQYGWRAQRIGLDINPFLCFVARTKANWRKYDPNQFNRLVGEFLAEPLRRDLSPKIWPALSTFHNPEMFSSHRVSALVDAVARIGKIPEAERDLLLLGVAAAAEKLGFYRKDGRGLRLLRTVGELQQRKYVRVESVLRNIWATYESDLRSLQAQPIPLIENCTVLCSDGCRIDLEAQMPVNPGQASLIAYSPPYLNHIDYTEVYKIELWLLGFVTNRKEMLELRKRTLRSHASTSFKSTGKFLPKNVRSIVEIAASEIAASGTAWHQRFQDTAFGYFEDMHQSFSRQFELLRPGCQAICIVANSAHGSGDSRIPIATDLLLAVIAADIGFEVEKLIIARQMRRRDHLNRFLRETVIVLKRPVMV